MKQIVYLSLIILIGFSSSTVAQLAGTGSDNLIAVTAGVSDVIMLRAGIVDTRSSKTESDDLENVGDRTATNVQTTTSDDNTIITTTNYKDGSSMEEHVAEDGSTTTVNWSSNGMNKITEIETAYGSEKIVTVIEELDKSDAKYEKGRITKKMTTTITATSDDGDVSETTNIKYIK